MKKLITLLLTAILLSSCGVSIESVVDHSAIKESYENPLIFIPYEKSSTKNFSQKLKEKLQVQFDSENRKVEFLLFEQGRKELSLNRNNNVDSKIDNIIKKDHKDIIFIFKPTDLSYYNGGLQSATYELTGIDISTKKEVWKAKFRSNSSFGPALFAEESAKTIYKKLKTDKVL